jgi:hypothetical protein
MPVWLIISTPRAALWQRGRPREDRSDWGGCCPDHSHCGGFGQQIGTNAHHLPPVDVDVFTWQLSQMPGIPREVIEHHLKI